MGLKNGAIGCCNQSHRSSCLVNQSYVRVILVDVSFPALGIPLYAATPPDPVKSHFVDKRRETGKVGLDGLAAKRVL